MYSPIVVIGSEKQMNKTPTFTVNGVVYTVTMETDTYLIGVSPSGSVRKVFK